MMDKRLLKEIPQAKQFIWKIVLVQWISLLSNIVFVFLLALIFAQGLQHRITHVSMLSCFLVMILCIILRMKCARKQALYSYYASCDVKQHLRKRIYEKVFELRNQYRQFVSTSELVQLSVEGIDQLEIYFGRYLPQLFYSMLAPITLFLIFVWVDVKSALVLFVCVPLIPLSIILVQKFAKRLLSKYWTSYANLGDRFLENLQGLTTLKIYQDDAYKNEQMNNDAQQFRRITMKVLTMQLNSISVMDIVAYGGAAIGSIVAVLSYQNGRISFIGVVCIILLSVEFFLPLRLLGSYFHVAMNGIAASDKIFRLLDIDETSNAKEDILKDSVQIICEHLCFSYNEHRPILKDVSLQMKPSECIALVGESGCGKSSFAKVLMGIERGYQGSLQINGKQRSCLHDESVYQRMSYVSHTPFMIKGSVRDNLLMGNPNANDEQMENALKQVNLFDFLMNEQGLDTLIVEAGANLSGGQKQRLAIARALLKDSDMYIFDEATSNIDVESEEIILSLIQKMTSHKSILLITHRLGSLRNCDCIYLLQDGQIIETGTHEQLVQQGSAYASLWQKQQELEGGEGNVK